MPSLSFPKDRKYFLLGFKIVQLNKIKQLLFPLQIVKYPVSENLCNFIRGKATISIRMIFLNCSYIQLFYDPPLCLLYITMLIISNYLHSIFNCFNNFQSLTS